MSARRVVLGRVSGVHGVRGWIKVYSYTDPREAIVDYREWLLTRAGEQREVRLLDGHAHGHTVIARLEGIDDRDAARALTDWQIEVPRDALPPPEPGEYYWADLEHMQVRTRDGRLLGEVDYMLATPAHDVMVIRGDRERLVPFVQGLYVLEVDTAERVITVDWDPEF